MDLSYAPILSSLILPSNSSLTFMIASYTMAPVTFLLVVVSYLLQIVLCLPEPSKIMQGREAHLLKRSVDSFIATESPIALADLLCNIGSSGACASGASAGIVVASPDRTNPNCIHPFLSCLVGSEAFCN